MPFSKKPTSGSRSGGNPDRRKRPASSSSQDQNMTRRMAPGASGNPPPPSETMRAEPMRTSSPLPPIPDRQAQGRSTRPVPPEHTAIADELRTHLKGKPTHSGNDHPWYSDVLSVILGVLKIALVFILCFAFIIGGFGAGMLVGYISTTTPVTVSDIRLSGEKKTSFVYDINGKEIAKLTGSENIDRIYVSFSDIKSTYIDEAIMAIEDERFLEHSGIDVKRIASAVISALLSDGSPSHGGSTITQQTIKLMSGQDQRSAQRKVQEWYRAMWFEQEMTKDEIMDYYVNLAPMGNNYIGVQAAAKNYFGKDAKELNLAECALLAGLPKSPSYYNPLRESGKRNALRRMRIVLGKMHELEMITDDEYNAALNTELVFKASVQSSSTPINSYFVEYAVSEVITDLQEQRNISRSLATTLVYNRGYQIYTTLEPDVQSVMDEAFMTQSLFQSNPEALEDLPEKPQAGMVVINVQTGAIAGMQGGYGPKTANLVYNRATEAYRQPGSSIKPLIAYAPALEIGYLAPGTIYDDKESFLDPANPTTRWPRNADGKYSGKMTVRRAITSSRNTIAVQVWTDIGADTALWFLKQVGIDRTNEAYPATAVGAFEIGPSPLQMASAFATFPREGVYCEPYAYTKVLDSSGNVVLEKHPMERSVYSEITAYLMSDMMMGVITGGTASGHVHTIQNIDGESISVAGKTGTTDDYKDRWFCGFTPYYSTAVWYGYDNHLRSTVVPKGEDRNSAMKIWDFVMQRIHANLPGASFVRPEGIISRTICIDSGQLATEHCKAAGTAVTDYFVEGSYLVPKTDCPFHLAPTPEPEPETPPDLLPPQ